MYLVSSEAESEGAALIWSGVRVQAKPPTLVHCKYDPLVDGAVIKAVENAIKALGIGFERANVGDRYVLELLKQRTG